MCRRLKVNFATKLRNRRDCVFQISECHAETVSKHAFQANPPAGHKPRSPPYHPPQCVRVEALSRCSRRGVIPHTGDRGSTPCGRAFVVRRMKLRLIVPGPSGARPQIPSRFDLGCCRNADEAKHTDTGSREEDRAAPVRRRLAGSSSTARPFGPRPRTAAPGYQGSRRIRQDLDRGRMGQAPSRDRQHRRVAWPRRRGRRTNPASLLHGARS